MSENSQPDITTLTVQLLSAFVSNNSVTSEGLAELIRTTRVALTEDPAADAAEAQAATYTPAVSARKSLSSPDHILSMIDGKPYKTLKRHLATHGLSPDEYRQRYNLPKSYPLVAPSYSEARRAVATRLGLGRKPAIAKAGDKAAVPKQAETGVKAAPKAAGANAGAKAPARKTAKAAKPVKAAAKPEAKAASAPAKPAKAAGAAPKAAKAPRKPRAKAAPAPAEANS